MVLSIGWYIASGTNSCWRHRSWWFHFRMFHLSIQLQYRFQFFKENCKKSEASRRYFGWIRSLGKCRSDHDCLSQSWMWPHGGLLSADANKKCWRTHVCFLQVLQMQPPVEWQIKTFGVQLIISTETLCILFIYPIRFIILLLLNQAMHCLFHDWPTTSVPCFRIPVSIWNALWYAFSKNWFSHSSQLPEASLYCY